LRVMVKFSQNFIFGYFTFFFFLLISSFSSSSSFYLATEIQNIQIAEGDVCRGLPIPIYMIFPRLFTCPTLAAKNFKVEFEVNVVVLFQDGYLLTENFPVKLVRTRA